MKTFRLRLHRGSPRESQPSRFVDYQVPMAAKMTVLDAVTWVQRNEEPELAYRYSCRVGMCGTCAMVINGREGWACRTLVEHLGRGAITVEPLRNLPVVKDLVVDMAPFFTAMTDAMAHYVPPQSDRPTPRAPHPDGSDWANIAEALRQRPLIDPHIECITCGACYSACTMISWDPQYLGPAALNRAATLVMDPRDGARNARLEAVAGEHGCWRCHSQFTCTEVCPMHLRPTESIGYLKRRYIAESVKQTFGNRTLSNEQKIGSPGSLKPTEDVVERLDSRRRFLRRAVGGLVSGIVASFSVTAAVFLGGRRAAEASEGWVSLGPAAGFSSGDPQEVIVQFGSSVADAPATFRRVYVAPSTPNGLAVLSSECTHLGCGVRWDLAIRQFICPCHGGAFDRDGRVTAGPPPEPLAVYESRIENGTLLVREK